MRPANTVGELASGEPVFGPGYRLPDGSPATPQHHEQARQGALAHGRRYQGSFFELVSDDTAELGD